MAANRKGNARTIQIATASAAITSGVPTVQEGWFGIPLNTMATNDSGEMAIEGRWNVAVPASTVKGDFLYVPATIGGTALTEAAAPTLTRTSSNSNAPVAKAMSDRDAAGNADIFILPPGASRAATQV